MSDLRSAGEIVDEACDVLQRQTAEITRLRTALEAAERERDGLRDSCDGWARVHAGQMRNLQEADQHRAKLCVDLVAATDAKDAALAQLGKARELITEFATTYHAPSTPEILRCDFCAEPVASSQPDCLGHRSLAFLAPSPPSTSPPCASWCGTMGVQKSGEDCHHIMKPGDWRCFCSIACRDAGHPLNPPGSREDK